ncbi:MAG: ATP-binding protein [Lachnoclostridium sp.]|nr:ATP-binding protein [Lachnoclostridium sp.]
MRFRWLEIAALAVIAASIAILLVKGDYSPTVLIICGLQTIVFVLASLALYFSARSDKMLESGKELLRGRDYASRLAPTGVQELDDVAELFNTMMQSLKEERLKVEERHKLLDLIVKATRSGIVILDFDGKIATMNPAAEDMLGVEEDEAKGKRPKEIPSDLAKAMETADGETAHTFRRGSNDVIHIERRQFFDRGFRRQFYTLDRITEEVVKAEKAAYERVIRMMAHEVNNSVTGMVSAIDLIKETTDDETLAEICRSSSERAMALAGFITSIARVARIPQPEMLTVDLQQLIERIIPFLESMTSGKDIRIALVTDDKGYTVKADPVLIEQTIVNIVKNSIESIDLEGDITLALGLTNHRVTLDITDNGHGLSEEAAADAFTPFFTTKSDGQGIGLMMVSEILRAHSCQFSLSTSSVSHLTTFSIEFT